MSASFFSQRFSCRNDGWCGPKNTPYLRIKLTTENSGNLFNSQLAKKLEVWLGKVRHSVFFQFSGMAEAWPRVHNHQGLGITADYNQEVGIDFLQARNELAHFHWRTEFLPSSAVILHLAPPRLAISGTLTPL